MRKHLCLWLVGSLVALAPTLAHADDEPKAYPECTKTPTDAETAAAKGAYQAGNASFDEADYPRALTYWEDAYRRDCTANLLLKNLARAYELYGQKRQAVVALETYLVREPSSPDKEQIQRRIEVLKKQIDAEKAAPPVPPPAPQTALAPPPAAGGPVPPPAAPTSSAQRPIWPLIVAGGGVVLTVVGLGVYGAAATELKGFEIRCPNRLCPEKTPTSPAGTLSQAQLIDQGNSARKRETAGGVITGIGFVTLAGGLIYYFVQPSSHETAGTLLRPRVTPAVMPGFAGLGLCGAF
jgi:hypothetical protein